MEYPQNSNPIFIVGCERSGTTMLRLMLHAHPNIAIPPQTKFLKKLYKRRLRFSNLSNSAQQEKLIQWFLKHFTKNTKLVDLKLDKIEVEKRMRLVSPTLGSFISIIYREYSYRQGKNRWGDKRPYYIKYIPQLLSLFPEAKIIHIIRDGRDCVASLKKMPWWKKSSMYSMMNWIEAVKAGERSEKTLPKTQFFSLRYEDLIDDPEKWLREITAFIGEPFNENMLHFQEIAKSAVPVYKDKWHYKTQQKISKQSVGRGLLELEPWELGLMNVVARKQLITNSYNIINTTPAIPVYRWIQFIGVFMIFTVKRKSEFLLDKCLSILYRGALAFSPDRRIN